MPDLGLLVSVVEALGVWVAASTAAFLLHLLIGISTVGLAEVRSQLAEFRREVGFVGIALHVVSGGLLNRGAKSDV
ncbi:hypothetical protein GLW36_05870 [Halorubrum terrestre]|uniref:Uncharacterized protein n=1 Tax=Halorubrum distributum TaxID=29283 RepID=A0A6B1ILZ8_9EURY|nr:hypothetical protein [Halorubrum terrestre]MYL16175.1 hypothetical protein [Halorubrum terrestre]